MNKLIELINLNKDIANASLYRAGTQNILELLDAKDKLYKHTPLSQILTKLIPNSVIVKELKETLGL